MVTIFLYIVESLGAVVVLFVAGAAIRHSITAIRNGRSFFGWWLMVLACLLAITLVVFELLRENVTINLASDLGLIWFLSNVIRASAGPPQRSGVVVPVRRKRA